MVDPHLIGAWLHARSIARGLPLPVADSGGWRIDTGSADEVRRHVYAAPDYGLTALGHAIHEPRVFLKLAAPSADLLAHLPPRWTIASESWVMTTVEPIGQAALPEGYSIEIVPGAVIWVRILDADGIVAASGRSARHDGVFIYDQIVTGALHRRRGLGRTLMAALGAHRLPGEQQVLTATADDRALYTALGWNVLAPQSTAVIAG